MRLGSSAAIAISTSLFLAAPAWAQIRKVPGPATCRGLPTVGKLRVTDIELTINGVNYSPCGIRKSAFPALDVKVVRANGNVCAVSLESGIVVKAQVKLETLPGAPIQDYGGLGFYQVTQYSNQRSPSGIANTTGPKANFACAKSAGFWEIDGVRADKSYDGFSPCARAAGGPIGPKCRADPTTPGGVIWESDMADNPFVAVEDAHTAYDNVFVGPVGRSTAPDRFQTWLIWNEPSNNLSPPAKGAPQWHALARIDWRWQGGAGEIGAAAKDCISTIHPSNGWEGGNLKAGVTAVVFGAAAGAPTQSSLRAHNNAWLPGPC